MKGETYEESNYTENDGSSYRGNNGNGSASLANAAEKEAGDIYSMTKEDLEGREITITTGEDWWHPPYQTLVEKISGRIWCKD